MLEDIQIFCTIARHQSFSKAARELDISTPVITRRLSRLEKSLQARLLNRTTRQVTMTEAGEKFYSEVSDILQLLEATKENVKSVTSQVAGTLKVVLPPGLGQCFVHYRLKDFLEKYPNLKLQIISDNHSLHLLQEGFDLVIQCGELPNSTYHYRKIATMRKVICASPDYLTKYGNPKTLDDLKKHNCLLLYNTLHRHWALRDKNKIIEVEVQGNITVNNVLELKNLALASVGIAHLPAYFIHKELEEGTLVSVLPEMQPIDYNLYAVYPTKKYLAKKTQVFLDFITDLMQDLIAGKYCR